MINKILLIAVLFFVLSSDVQAGNPVYSVVYKNTSKFTVSINGSQENCGVMQPNYDFSIRPGQTIHRSVYRNNSGSCDSVDAKINQYVNVNGRPAGYVNITAMQYYNWEAKAKGGYDGPVDVPCMGIDSTSQGGHMVVEFKNWPVCD